MYFQVVIIADHHYYQFTDEAHLSFHLIFLFRLYRLGDFDLVARSSKILRFIFSDFSLNHSLLIEQLRKSTSQCPKVCTIALLFWIQIVVLCTCVAEDLIFDRSSSLKIVYALCRFDSKARAQNAAYEN